jgi:hypothetical protein
VTLRLIPWILAAGLVSVSGCKDQNPVGEGDSPSNVIVPISGVSYARQVQPLFNQTCAIVGCHGDGTQTSALRLTSYDNLMYGGTLDVIRNQPDQSMLVMRIEGRVGERMPMNRRPLNQNQINGIRAWIGEGALNN